MDETAKDLGTMLDEKRVLGYVDTLRESIVQRREQEWEGGVDHIRDSRVTVWEEAREVIGTPGLDVEVRDNTETMGRKGRKADHGFVLRSRG